MGAPHPMTIRIAIAALLLSAVSGQYWHAVRIDDGKVRVVCDNGGDATIEPTSQFGSIVVSCGTRGER